MKHIIYIASLIMLISSSYYGNGQDLSDWGKEKLRGELYVEQLYLGNQYIYNGWNEGQIELISGEILNYDLMKYNAFLNELVIFNSTLLQMVKVDKASIKGFVLFMNGEGHSYVNMEFNNSFFNGDYYLEKLFEGKNSFYCLRRINAMQVNLYVDEYGVQRNEELVRDDIYLMKGERDGFHRVRSFKNWLTNKMEKKEKRTAKKLLRSNRIKIKNEENFIEALKLFEHNNLSIKL